MTVYDRNTEGLELVHKLADNVKNRICEFRCNRKLDNKLLN